MSQAKEFLRKMRVKKTLSQDESTTSRNSSSSSSENPNGSKDSLCSKNCFRCGQIGHKSKDCPDHPHRTGRNHEVQQFGRGHAGRYIRGGSSQQPRDSKRVHVEDEVILAAVAVLPTNEDEYNICEPRQKCNLIEKCSSSTTIANLPMEILLNIFKYLKILEDIENCLNTCQLWRLILVDFFVQNYLLRLSRQNNEIKQQLIDDGWKEDNYCIDDVVSIFQKLIKGKILVTTGYPYENGQKTEIIDLANDATKVLPFDFLKRDGMIGGFVQTQPLICGGEYHPEERYFRKCFILGRQQQEQPVVNEKIMTLEQRSDAASIVINQNILWIIGGRDKYKIHPSTEFLTISSSSSSPPFESTDGPMLPFTIHSHGVVQYDSSSVYIIGGYQDGKWSDKTWILDPDNNFQIREGPTLNVARCNHSCGKMRIKGKNFIVVAGGFFEDSVEILDPSNADGGWRLGPKLPFHLRNSAMVTSPSGESVILIGGFIATNRTHSNILLEWKGKSKKWIQLNQTLTFARERHLAFSISEECFINLKDFGQLHCHQVCAVNE